MSAIPCPVCGKLRTVEQICTSAGWINPACWNCGDPGWVQPLDAEDPLEGRKDTTKLFSNYTFCPRNPYGDSSREQHEKQDLVHYFFDGRVYCTSRDALPSGAVPL